MSVHAHTHDHGHSHGLVHASIRRSRAGSRAVGFSLAILGATAVAQTAVFVATDSVALLADLVHNFVIRLLDPRDPEALGALAAAGALGFVGNWFAAGIRTRAGRRLDSPALIADGAHARADAYVSLAVVASAAAIALGYGFADPLIGLAITAVILRIARDSWRTIRGHAH